MEQVNHPDHYQGSNGVEAIDAIEAAISTTGLFDFCIGNAIKYLMRSKKKHEDPTDDLEKTIWYVNKAIETHKKIKEEEKKQ